MRKIAVKKRKIPVKFYRYFEVASYPLLIGFDKNQPAFVDSLSAAIVVLAPMVKPIQLSKTRTRALVQQARLAALAKAASKGLWGV